MKNINDNASEHLFSRMRSEYGSFTMSERRIADYLLELGNNVRPMSAQELASEVGVSEATVVRFSQKLRFSGYPTFSRALITELLTQSQYPHEVQYRELAPQDSLGTVTEKLFVLMQTALDDTLKNLDRDALQRATQEIANAQQIDLYAYGGSASIALNAQNKFVYSGINLTARIDVETQATYAQFLGPGNVAIALSHAGRSESVREAMYIARMRGALTIGITSNSRSPIAQGCDIHLLVSLPRTSIGQEAGIIRIAQVAILDCLALAVAHQRLGRSATAAMSG